MESFWGKHISPSFCLIVTRWMGYLNCFYAYNIQGEIMLTRELRNLNLTQEVSHCGCCNVYLCQWARSTQCYLIVNVSWNRRRSRYVMRIVDKARVLRKRSHVVVGQLEALCRRPRSLVQSPRERICRSILLGFVWYRLAFFANPQINTRDVQWHTRKTASRTCI